YKLSLYNTNIWINGQQEPLNMQLQQAMFYPNTYLNFNGNGEYTKHYYNGTERIASRLGDNTTTIAINSNILEDRKLSLEEHFRVDIHKLIYETIPIDMPPFIDVNTLQPTGTPNDIYYYHPNHLGNTAFVTDQNQNITQGFLYAPFGEITTEYNINFGNNVIPKYSFNAKEMDEETGFYYYEARYYAPPVFTSRDLLFEKYFWMSPYAYCANNPVKYVDPDGKKFVVPRVKINGQKGRYNVTFDGTSVTMQRTGIKKTSEVISYQVGTNKYVDDMIASYNYIVNCDGADVDNAMKEIANSPFTVKVIKRRYEACYSWNKIYYDFSQGSKIEREDGVSGYQSPALGFWSEVYHAYLDIIDKKTKKSLSSFSDTYNLKEENYVHVTKENVVIDALNSCYGANETKRNVYEDNKYGVTMKKVTETNIDNKIQ
ncbi:MAG: RHS repeat-associated core domain-containing protein, partial [Bacteroidales bacterium]|nr:RHS repeat-associated core domain-containing protein [Bacteroidales bacterium]